MTSVGIKFAYLSEETKMAMKNINELTEVELKQALTEMQDKFIHLSQDKVPANSLVVAKDNELIGKTAELAKKLR